MGLESWGKVFQCVTLIRHFGLKTPIIKRRQLVTLLILSLWVTISISLLKKGRYLRGLLLLCSFRRYIQSPSLCIAGSSEDTAEPLRSSEVCECGEVRSGEVTACYKPLLRGCIQMRLDGTASLSVVPLPTFFFSFFLSLFPKRPCYFILNYFLWQSNQISKALETSSPKSSVQAYRNYRMKKRSTCGIFSRRNREKNTFVRSHAYSHKDKALEFGNLRGPAEHNSVI